MSYPCAVLLQAFLFSNRTDATRFTKFAIKPNSVHSAVVHGDGVGPAFGNTDLWLLGNADGSRNLSTGCSYEFNGYELTATSSDYYSVDDVEVFSVKELL